MGLFKSKKQEVNQINNKELKEKLLDNALAFLVNANEIKTEDFKGIQAKFGYLLMLENHGIEALFKIIKDDKIFYFAFLLFLKRLHFLYSPYLFSFQILFYT